MHKALPNDMDPVIIQPANLGDSSDSDLDSSTSFNRDRQDSEVQMDVESPELGSNAQGSPLSSVDGL